MFFNDESFQFLGSLSNRSGSNRYSFLDSKYHDLEEWKHEAKRVIHQGLCYTPVSVPYNEEIVEELDFGNYTRKKVLFYSAHNCRIPAYLLIPNNLQNPAPGIVVMHDHGGMFYWGKEKAVELSAAHPLLKNHIACYYSDMPLASELAKRGYVALVIDSLFFGERRWKLENHEEYKKRLGTWEFESAEYIAEYNKMEQEIESDLVRSIFYQGKTFLGIRTHDDIRSVSYLAERPEVDANRIGCIGLSMGGHRSGWLHALDDRVTCAVIVGWMARHLEMVEHRIGNIAWMWAAPDIYRSLDYPDIVALAAPKPLLVQHGIRDSLFPKQTGEIAMDIIKKVYSKAGFEDGFQGELYDGPHEFHASMQASAFAWLDRHLKND